MGRQCLRREAGSLPFHSNLICPSDQRTPSLAFPSRNELRNRRRRSLYVGGERWRIVAWKESKPGAFPRRVRRMYCSSCVSVIPPSSLRVQDGETPHPSNARSISHGEAAEPEYASEGHTKSVKRQHLPQSVRTSSTPSTVPEIGRR
jgi:hypothetical protein